MSRTDTAVRVISASPDRVFAALTDSDALACGYRPTDDRPVRALRCASRRVLPTDPGVRGRVGRAGSPPSTPTWSTPWEVTPSTPNHASTSGPTIARRDQRCGFSLVGDVPNLKHVPSARAILDVALNPVAASVARGGFRAGTPGRSRVRQAPGPPRAHLRRPPRSWRRAGSSPRTSCRAPGRPGASLRRAVDRGVRMALVAAKPLRNTSNATMPNPPVGPAAAGVRWWIPLRQAARTARRDAEAQAFPIVWHLRRARLYVEGNESRAETSPG
jgi:hypothetical protein